MKLKSVGWLIAVLWGSIIAIAIAGCYVFDRIILIIEYVKSLQKTRGEIARSEEP